MTRYIIGLLSIITVFSCGIPTLPYLAPPTPISVDSSTLILRFRHNTDNDSSTLSGYDIFYKFYTTENELTTDAAAIEGVLTHQTLLEGNGRIFPLYRLDGSNTKITDSPLVALDALDMASDTEFQLEFLSSPFTLTNNRSGDTTNIYRLSSSVTDTDAPLPFSFDNHSFDPSWQDIPDTFDDTAALEIFVGFYACAFGYYDTFTRVYSKTILLEKKIIRK